MKVNGIGRCSDINEYVKKKIDFFEKTDKNFENLFSFMFSEEDNIMYEQNNGHRIEKTTYGQCKAHTLKIAGILQKRLSHCTMNSIVGIYMQNSPMWIEVFWSVLMCGFRPLLMNTRLDDYTLNGILKDYKVAAVISDQKTFCTETIMSQELIPDDSIPQVTPVWADEIIIMSSGTSADIKLCVYSGKRFFNQVCDSAEIIKESKQMKQHYEGNLKQLVFLPFYHIFGLAAMYMWFGFFSRTFVFLKDYAPDTILNTVRKHKVTHIFAIPMFWNKIYDAAIKKIKAKGSKTYSKFTKGLKIANKLGTDTPLGKMFIKKAFKEVRDNIFGDSICFLISGGSMISPKVISFFNGIGYHMANGYGMSEIGITSVELSQNSKIRNTGSVGRPFTSVEYRINDCGELMVKSSSRADYILQKGEKIISAEDGWFSTLDLATCENGRYYITGRQDSMIPCKNGENLNPGRIEGLINIEGALDWCISQKKGKLNDVTPVLAVQVNRYSTPEKLQSVLAESASQLAQLNLEKNVTEIILTDTPLMGENDFKLNRRRIAQDLAQGKMSVISPEAIHSVNSEIPSELLHKATKIFAEALNKKPEEIPTDADFFHQLGGTSLDYFAMLSAVQREFSIPVAENSAENISTVRELCIYIQKTL